MGIASRRTSRIHVIFIIGVLYITVCSSRLPVSALDGDLDPTFGSGGQVMNPVSGDVVVSAGMVIQRDGKIVTGASIADNNFDIVVLLTRNNADGSLDAGFGTGGTVTTNITGEDFARAIALQPDGRLLVVGDTSTNFGNPSFLVLRYNVDGTLDTGFGSAGSVVTRVGRVNDSARAVVLQPDGKIVAGGYSAAAPLTSSSDHSDFALVRYNTDGSLDPSFGNGGIVTTVLGGGTFEGSDLDAVDALAIQIDGKILAAGEVLDAQLQSVDVVVIRYNPDGSIDTAFGNGGKVVTRTGSLNYPKGIAVQSDLKILVGGQSWSTSPEVPRFLLARYNPDGSPDPNFGNGGVVITSFGFPTDILGDRAFGMALQSDGKIIEVGSAGLPVIRFAVARYNSDGGLDPSFGSGGVATTDILGHPGTATGVGIQKDGKIVAAGQVQLTEKQNSLGLARFESSGGAPDFSLAPDQAQIDVTPGTKVPVTINISRNGGFQGPVQIAPPDTTGTGIKVKPAATIAAGGNSATFKLKITGVASPGTINLTFTGTDASGSVSAASVRLVVH